MSIKFVVRDHSVRDGQLVEIWQDGRFIGCIYPLTSEHFPDMAGLRIVSKYAKQMMREASHAGELPAYRVIFENIKPSRD